MMSLNVVLLVFAFACFVLAAWLYQPPSPHHGRLIAVGLACWVASQIFFR